MPDGVSTLAGIRERAIAELDQFLQNECFGVPGPSDAGQRTWEVRIQPGAEVRRLSIDVDSLIDRPPFPGWPHIEPSGTLCIAEESYPLDPTRPAVEARYLLTKRIFPLIAACESGSNLDDLRAEFYSYWNRTVSSGAKPTLSLLTCAGPSRVIALWRGKLYYVIADDAETIVSWLGNRSGTNIKPDSIEPACLIWLDQPLLPCDYPHHATDVWQIASSVSEGSKLLSSIVSQRQKVTRITMGAISENGPCLFGVDVPWPTFADSRGRRRDDAVFHGFRPDHLPREELARRVFMTRERVLPVQVERVDAAWIHGRGRDQRQPRLRCARIAVAGCGSVGAAVANQLARSGIGNILLIDPDTLSWANIGRHILGANDVDSFKARALESFLRANLPHGHFESKIGRLEEVLTGSPEALRNCDAIVCATASWPAEAALNLWQIAETKPPFIIYGWTEPEATAGHAVAIKNGSSCLQCQFSSDGKPQLEITRWPEGERVSREPACGAIYQPYGPVEITWTTCLVSTLVLDCLLGTVAESIERIWACPTSMLNDAGGSWSPEWLSERAARENGGFTEERLWPKNPACPACR